MGDSGTFEHNFAHYSFSLPTRAACRNNQILRNSMRHWIDLNNVLVVGDVLGTSITYENDNY